MEIVLNRLQCDPDVTIGELLVDGQFECWTCEDTVRAQGFKVPGKTAIPYGRYEIIVTMSQRFGVMLPLLLNVPMFSGIRIHPGNTAADTEGCILPGEVRLGKSVGRSRAAFNVLFPRIRDSIAAGQKVFIKVQNGVQP